MTAISIRHDEPQVASQLRPVVIAVVSMKIIVAALLLVSVNLASPLMAEQQVASLSDF